MVTCAEARSTGRSTPTTAPWCCSPRSALIGDVAAALVAAGRAAADPGRDDPRRHHHRAGDRRLDARHGSPPTPAPPGWPRRPSPWSATSSTCARRCPGSRPSRCSAGGCWCRAPRSRPARCSQRLRGYGAVPEEVPTISVEPPRNPQQMDKAIRGLVEGRYEWIAFTSVNAVKAVREKFEEYGLDARAFSGLKIAAVGDKTAAGDRGLGPARRPGALRRAVRGRAARGLAAVRRRCSTRSTGSSCRAPTSPPRPWSPG